MGYKVKLITDGVKGIWPGASDQAGALAAEEAFYSRFDKLPGFERVTSQEVLKMECAQPANTTTTTTNQESSASLQRAGSLTPLFAALFVLCSTLYMSGLSYTCLR